jgi:UDP-glucuronate 4-epimerase
MSLASYRDAAWEKEMRQSTKPSRDGMISVLVTDAARFEGTHYSLVLPW